MLHSLNPMTKLVYALCLTIVAFVIQYPVILFAIGLLNMLFASSARVWKSFFSMFLKTILPIVIPLFIIQSLFYPGGQTVLWSWGFLSVKAEGVNFALLISSRLITLVTSYFVFILTTAPKDLAVCLEQRGVSRKVSYLLVSTLQLLPYMIRTAQSIIQAQRSRGVDMEGNLITRAKAYVPLIGPVVMGSIASLEVRAMALEARGFNAGLKKTFLRDVVDTPVERTGRVALVLLTGGLVILRIWLAVR